MPGFWLILARSSKVKRMAFCLPSWLNGQPRRLSYKNLAVFALSEIALGRVEVAVRLAMGTIRIAQNPVD